MKQKSSSSCGRTGLAIMDRGHPASIQAFLLLSCVQNWHHCVYGHLCVWVTLGSCGCWCLVKPLAAVEAVSTEVVVSSCTCVPGTRCKNHLGLVSYTEGVEDKLDKANLEQYNLKFKNQDANEACFSFPPPTDCSSLSRKLLS